MKASGTASPPGTPKRLAAVDGLRGIAALLILFGHWIGLGVPADYGTPLYVLKRLLWLNSSGVDLFFVLSGFLIGGILVDQRSSPNLLPVFWLRRAVRILPLFAIFLGAFALLARSGHPPLVTPNTQPLWAHAAFLCNLFTAFTGQIDASFLASTWSLAIEEQVYLLLPLGVLAVPPALLGRTALGVILTAPLVRALVWFLEGNELSSAAHNLPFCRADAFAVGLCIAIESRRSAPCWARQQPSRVILLGALPGLLLFWLTRRNEWMGSLLYCIVGYSACALFYGWSLVLALSVPRATAWLSNLPLVWFGRHSYFVYLFHGIVAVLVERALVQWPGSLGQNIAFRLTVSLVLLVACATASMRWFESPLLRWGHRHRYQPAPTPPAPPA